MRSTNLKKQNKELTMDNVEKSIISIIQNQLLGADVNEHKSFEENGFDSLDLISVIMTIEDQYDIAIDEREVDIDTKISDFISHVEQIVESESEKEVE